MAQKSKWIEVDENYWSESKSNAFNFDEFDESLDILNAEPTSSSPIETTVGPSKGSDLKLSESAAKKQLQSLLTTDDSLSPKVISEKLSPKEAIGWLSKRNDINLGLYKGKEEKLQLIDTAVDTIDSNAVMTTVLHFNRTIKPSIFNYELSKRSVASDHYMFYLRENQRTDQLIDTLVMLGRHEEAAITAYNQAISCSNPETKIHNLKNCLRNHFSTGGNDVLFWRDFIAEQISLLEQQLPIEADDKRQEMNALNHLFFDIPRQPLPDSSVISTLFYCCLYHYSLPENHFASPKAICKSYHLSQKQLVWTALMALAVSKRWPEVDSLFEYKSWLGNKKMKSLIPFDKVLSILHKNEAPQEILEKYLILIDDFDVRFESAKDVKLIKTVIDVLIKSRDHKKLEEISTKLSPKSEEYFYIQSALASIKWKN